MIPCGTDFPSQVLLLRVADLAPIQSFLGPSAVDGRRAVTAVSTALRDWLRLSWRQRHQVDSRTHSLDYSRVCDTVTPCMCVYVWLTLDRATLPVSSVSQRGHLLWQLHRQLLPVQLWRRLHRTTMSIWSVTSLRCWVFPVTAITETNTVSQPSVSAVTETVRKSFSHLQPKPKPKASGGTFGLS